MPTFIRHRGVDLLDSSPNNWYYPSEQLVWDICPLWHYPEPRDPSLPALWSLYSSNSGITMKHFLWNHNWDTPNEHRFLLKEWNCFLRIKIRDIARYRAPGRSVLGPLGIHLTRTDLAEASDEFFIGSKFWRRKRLISSRLAVWRLASTRVHDMSPEDAATAQAFLANPGDLQAFAAVVRQLLTRILLLIRDGEPRLWEAGLQAIRQGELLLDPNMFLEEENYLLHQALALTRSIKFWEKSHVVPFPPDMAPELTMTEEHAPRVSNIDRHIVDALDSALDLSIDDLSSEACNSVTAPEDFTLALRDLTNYSLEDHYNVCLSYQRIRDLNLPYFPEFYRMLADIVARYRADFPTHFPMPSVVLPSAAASTEENRLWYLLAVHARPDYPVSNRTAAEAEDELDYDPDFVSDSESDYESEYEGMPEDQRRRPEGPSGENDDDPME